MQNKTFISLAILLATWVVLAAQLHTNHVSQQPAFHMDATSNAASTAVPPNAEQPTFYKGQITHYLIQQLQGQHAEQWSPESLYMLNDALTERISFI